MNIGNVIVLVNKPNPPILSEWPVRPILPHAEDTIKGRLDVASIDHSIIIEFIGWLGGEHGTAKAFLMHNLYRVSNQTTERRNLEH